MNCHLPYLEIKDYLARLRCRKMIILHFAVLYVISEGFLITLCCRSFIKIPKHSQKKKLIFKNLIVTFLHEHLGPSQTLPFLLTLCDLENKAPVTDCAKCFWFCFCFELVPRVNMCPASSHCSVRCVTPITNTFQTTSRAKMNSRQETECWLYTQERKSASTATNRLLLFWGLCSSGHYCLGYGIQQPQFKAST